MIDLLKLDPYFRVEVDTDGSSPNPQVSIWRGQHQCVSEGFAFDSIRPTPSRCGEIVVKYQLQGDRGHYSVLDQAFFKIDCGWFPHSVVSQITRHRDSAFLVQSSRYTGERFIDVANGDRGVEEVFYFRPVGHYTNREGKKYEISEDARSIRILEASRACVLYANLIEDGYSEEDARDVIPYSFRQHFTMSGTVADFLHWIDQRSKKDSQLEIQALAAMAFEKFSTFAPEIAAWYKENRYGKARLAP